MKKLGLEILDSHLKHATNAAKANPEKYTYMVESLTEIREGLLKETGLQKFWSKFCKNWKIKVSYKGFFQKNK